MPEQPEGGDPNGGDGIPPDDGGDAGGGGVGGGRIKYVVGNVPVFVVAERVQYYGADGKLITESLRD